MLDQAGLTSPSRAPSRAWLRAVGGGALALVVALAAWGALAAEARAGSGDTPRAVVAPNAARAPAASTTAAKDGSPDAPTLSPVAPAAYVDTVVAPRKGKVLVASFWASYCVTCLTEMPMLVALDRARADVDLVLVSTDPEDWLPKARAALVKLGIAGVPLYWADAEDPQPFIDAVDPSWAGELPYTVVYGADGRRAVTLSGEVTKAQVEAAIAKAQALR